MPSMITPGDSALTAFKAEAPASPVPPAARGASRDRTQPPRRGGKLTVWLLLLICLIAASVPMLIDIQRADVVDPLEALALATSAETWRMYEQTPIDEWGFEPFTPRYQGLDRIGTPPGTTWLHMLAFEIDRDIEGRSPSVERMILLGRLVSVCVALLALSALYWIGYSIGGLPAAFFATVVCLSDPVFIYEARSASPVMPALAFATLAIAAALWAIRPLRPSPSLFRQGLGWIISGFALGMAMLMDSATMAVPVVLSILVVLLLSPRRISHTMGLIAAVFIGLLLVTPWLVYAHENDPVVWWQWLERFEPLEGSLGDIGRLVGWRMAMVLAVALPWTIWLVVALVQPFSTSSTGQRRRLFLSWSWFVTVGVLALALPGADDLAVLAILLPAGAMLIGQLFTQFAALSAEGRHVRLWRVLRWAQIAAMLVASIALSGAMIYGPTLVADGYLDMPITTPMHWTYAAGMGLVLVLLVGLSIRSAAKHYPGQTLVIWAAWTIAAMVMLSPPVARGPLGVSSARDDALALRQITVNSAFYVLDVAEPIDPAILLYSEDTIPVAPIEQLSALGDRDDTMFVLAPLALAAEPGFYQVKDLPDLGLTLWRRDRVIEVEPIESETSAPEAVMDR